MTQPAMQLRQPPYPGQRRGGALSPTASVVLAVGASALAAWLWSRATQPGIDAQTRARLQPPRARLQPRQPSR